MPTGINGSQDGLVKANGSKVQQSPVRSTSVGGKLQRRKDKGALIAQQAAKAAESKQSVQNSAKAVIEDSQSSILDLQNLQGQAVLAADMHTAAQLETYVLTYEQRRDMGDRAVEAFVGQVQEGLAQRPEANQGADVFGEFLSSLFQETAGE
jgi:hypothetical protein